jgi:hypothetical protein
MANEKWSYDWKYNLHLLHCWRKLNDEIKKLKFLERYVII